MSALTSLLVRDQVVSVRKIEEAIQRQVISGGELESVLLEMSAVPENVMAAYRAALHGLLPATRDEVMKVPRETIKLVPREVAEQYRLVPLWAENRTLVVAVTTPLSPEVDEQLSFLLGHDLVYRIVTDVRLAAALHHHYGSEVPPRMRRLADKLREREPGKVPYVAPPQEEKVDPTALTLKKKGLAAEVDWDDERPSEPELAPEDRPRHRGTDKLIAPPPPGSEQVGMGRVVGVGPGERSPSAGPATRPPPATTASRPPRSRSTRPDSPLLRKLRGPLTAKVAVDFLGQAADRDEILEIFFAFAKQFFDYAALFVVHEGEADGREAWGPGATTDDVSRMAVPLDTPGSFHDVHEAQAPRVVDLAAGELDHIVAKDLGRLGSQPAFLAPVAIRKRVVLMLYGDRDGEAFEVSDVPELVAFLPRVAEAFEKLILKRKFKGYGGSGEKGKRSDLKAAVGRMGVVQPTAPVKTVGAYRASNPSPEPAPSPATDEQPASDGEEPEPAAAEPSASALPVTTQPAPAEEGASEPEPQSHVEPAGPSPSRDNGRTRKHSPLEVLGVPRSAPPPPMGGEQGGVPKVTRPDGAAAAAARAARHDSVVEDEPEVSIEPAAEDDPDFAAAEREELSAPPRTEGTYSLRDAATDVLGGSTSQRSGRRTPRKGRSSKKPRTDRPPMLRNRRRDPRREDDGAGTMAEVVHLPKSTGDAAAGPAPENEPTGPNGRARRRERDTKDERPPGAKLRPDSEEPSVIVDMGDTVEALVDDLVQCGPEDESAAVEALRSVGEASLPALVQRFPGPLWFDRNQPHRRLPRGRDVSAVARAIVGFGERAVPYVGSLVGSREADTRFYATLLASELLSPELIGPLAQRIFDEDKGTRVLVLDVLRCFGKYDKEVEEVLKGVRVEARVDRRDPDRRLHAIRALGELRDTKSVELLIGLLGSDDTAITETAHRALVLITRQDFGDSQRKWYQWLEKHGDQHRIEWLIDSLLHADEEIRTAAGEELKNLTQEYHGYHPGSPRRDREIAQKKYRTWWENEGRSRFVKK